MIFTSLNYPLSTINVSIKKPQYYCFIPNLNYKQTLAIWTTKHTKSFISAFVCVDVCVCVHWHVFLFVSFVSLNKIKNIWYFLLHWHWTGSDNISIKLINYLSSPIYSGPDTHFVALRCFLCFCFFFFPHFSFQLFHKVFVRFLSVFSCRKMFRISVHAHT